MVITGEERDMSNVLGRNIRSRRLAKGVSQQELGEAVGITSEGTSAQVKVSDWERGITEPRVSTVIKIAKFLGCSVEDLIREESE